MPKETSSSSRSVRCNLKLFISLVQLYNRKKREDRIKVVVVDKLGLHDFVCASKVDQFLFSF